MKHTASAFIIFAAAIPTAFRATSVLAQDAGNAEQQQQGGTAANDPQLADAPTGNELVDPATGRASITPPTPLETADQIAQRMFVTGGSLMQAQLEMTQVNPEMTTPAAAAPFGFFAVPEPEPTVIEKHDLVTVIVREESSSKSSSTTELEKSYEFEAIIEEFLRFDGINLDSRADQDRLAAEFERGFEGEGTFDRKDSFITRLQARVLDVKPNGTLVLEATRNIITDDEEQTFRLIGTCRVEDITADNSILSTQLAGLKLEKHTDGAVSEASKRGWVPRIIDKVNPF